MIIKNLKFQTNGGAVSVCSLLMVFLEGRHQLVEQVVFHQKLLLPQVIVASFFQWLLSVLVLFQNAALAVLLKSCWCHCCRNCDGLQGCLLEPCCDIFSCLVATCLLCGEEQEDLNTPACLHNLEGILLFFSGRANQTSFRGLKLSVAVKISQDCLCHSRIHIVMKQLVFSCPAESWTAFIFAMKLLNIPKVSLHTFFSSVHLACFNDSLTCANKYTYRSTSKSGGTRNTHVLFHKALGLFIF